ncbi:MAG: 2',3'-cyclic-nucleotide 2'-phosphodiesterase [Bacteroidetes bacterium]|nr:2',3'-cyclic-nucleotide 2'-phosphodiesterase [Bacteroidota bacterium]
MEGMVSVIIGVLAAGIGVAVGWYFSVRMGKNKVASARDVAKKIIEQAGKESETLKREKLLEVKDEWYAKKKEFDSDLQSKRAKQQAQEKALEAREENIDRKVELLNKKEREQAALRKSLEEKARAMELKQQELEKAVTEQNIRLERTSGLSREEAKKILMENLLNEAKGEAAHMLKDVRDKAKDEAKREAQKLIVQAIQRTAADHSVETTVSVLNIQSDEMKGRIIGREGRNIRAFEAATGVDVIVDDTPEAVILSAFDPFRREVARLSLERLIADGRIHPARIEEVVEKVRAELEEEVIRTGENTLLEVGLQGAQKEILSLLGRMKYRSSYGQNMLQHSTEVAFLTGMMAAELGLDETLAKRAALFHDIGKCVDKSVEGPHALIGADVAKKCGEHPLVVNAIGAHHDDIPMESPIAALVQAADSISGARPGARRESVEGYAKRLEKLEALAQSFQGVAKTYAIQAGREIRVVVEQEKVDDVMADQLAHDIAAKIQEEMEYPGQIRVTVIREFRSVAFAK